MVIYDLKSRFFYWSYFRILRRFLFLFGPEFMHKTFISIGRILGSNKFTRRVVRFCFDYQNKKLEQNILGINFRNPVGLSAGFDKNAQMIEVMESVGFGFSEVGSVTFLASEGNMGQRMKRIVDKKALWVNLGLNNLGARRIHNNLKSKKFQIPYGINIAKTNCKETADDKVGLKDYLGSVELFRDVGNYIVLNISCPNAFGGQPFSRKKAYQDLLNGVDKLKIKKPVFVKLSPDLTKSQIDDIIRITKEHKIAGFICSNLTKSGKSGGFSGKIVKEKSNELLKYIYQKTKGKYVLIGVGGISSAEEAYHKIKLGANLVELISGMIFEGPQLIGRINFELVKLIEKDGYKNIAEAVGKGNIFK